MSSFHSIEHYAVDSDFDEFRQNTFHKITIFQNRINAIFILPFLTKVIKLLNNLVLSFQDKTPLRNLPYEMGHPTSLTPFTYLTLTHTFIDISQLLSVSKLAPINKKISILSHPQSSRHLENALVKDLSLLHGQSLPALERGPIVKYFPTAGSVFRTFLDVKCLMLHDVLESEFDHFNNL